MQGVACSQNGKGHSISLVSCYSYYGILQAGAKMEDIHFAQMNIANAHAFQQASKRTETIHDFGMHIGD